MQVVEVTALQLGIIFKGRENTFNAVDLSKDFKSGAQACVTFPFS